MSLEKVEASVREELGEGSTSPAGKVLAGKLEGLEGPPVAAGCLRSLARAEEHVGAIQESQRLAGAVAWALPALLPVGEVVLARGWFLEPLERRLKVLLAQLLGPRRSGHRRASRNSRRSLEQRSAKNHASNHWAEKKRLALDQVSVLQGLPSYQL